MRSAIPRKRNKFFPSSGDSPMNFLGIFLRKSLKTLNILLFLEKLLPFREDQA